MLPVRLDNDMDKLVRVCTAILIYVALFSFDVTAARAQSGVPPPEMLDAIFPVLRHKRPPLPPLKVSISRATDQSENPSCDLAPLELMRTRNGDRRVFKLFGTLNSDKNSQPSALLVRLQRLTVDADGSRRAYHPEDPFGRGVCDPNASAVSLADKICALDNLANAGIRVFQGAQSIPQFRNTGPDWRSEPNSDFQKVWATLWSRIADRQPGWVDLGSLFGKKAPANLRLYYSKPDNAAAVFDADVIPFRDGYPCQHGAGYFVAATAPMPNIKSRVPQDACSTASYLDSSDVPFFVLPGNVFQNLQVGDAAIAFARIGDLDRLVFGIVGDIGPPGQIGEGSILFARRIRGMDVAEPKNSVDLGGVDVIVKNTTAAINSLSVLILGGTAKEYRGNYSTVNIEKVGRIQLANWTKDRPDRLKSCAEAAAANPLNGFEQPDPN